LIAAFLVVIFIGTCFSVSATFEKPASDKNSKSICPSTHGPGDPLVIVLMEDSFRMIRGAKVTLSNEDHNIVLKGRLIGYSERRYNVPSGDYTLTVDATEFGYPVHYDTFYMPEGFESPSYKVVRLYK
jgi:hypothetical protein